MAYFFGPPCVYGVTNFVSKVAVKLPEITKCGEKNGALNSIKITV